MLNNRWRIHRAGLVNFWYYDDEEFHFSEGKLLLRGSNGSGKSVTMQSLIPLLLDGNKSPERLDPFGSKARKLENYLLEEDEPEKEENTAYLYMEFKKEQSENYLTLGMGFKAQKGKNLKSWGFAITDGRRIGQDFYLYKDVGDKLPLTKKELENRIGTGGLVKDGQGDYMKMVNDLLFGFDEIEEYDELIKLLVQLRTPKLSKDFKPTVVYEIMENSLQQLSEDDLRPMSEAIENMDSIKSRLEELKESKKAAEKIKDAYDKYNRFLLYDKAKSYTAAVGEYEKLLENKKRIEEKRDISKEQYENASMKVEDLKVKRIAAEEKKKELDIHDSVRIKERILEVEKNIEAAQREKTDKGDQLDKKKGRERQLYFKIKEHKENEELQLQKIRDALEEMDSLSAEFAFDEQSFMKTEILRDIGKTYNFQFIKNDLKGHIHNLGAVRDILDERERQNKQYDKALSDLAAANAERDSRQKKLNEVALLLSETKEELIERIYTWRKGNQELIVSDAVLIRLSREIQNFSEESSFDEIISIVREILNQAADRLNKEIAGLGFELERLEESRRTLEAQIAEWKNREDIEPERSEKITANRRRLTAHHIPYVPLYKAIDFKEDVPDVVRGRIEEALLDMGLLDALIIPDEYRQKALQMDPDMGDKYIFPSPNFLTHDVTELLKPEKIDVEGITRENIDGALKSILIDEGNSSVYINEKGQYGIGILRGKTTDNHIPKFIGTTARARFRTEKIEALKEELFHLEEVVLKVKKDRETFLDRMKALKEEFDDFPKDKDLRVAVHELKDARFNLEKAEEAVVAKEVEEKRVYAELKELNQKIHGLTQKINLKANLEVYEEALKASAEYRELLFGLENLHDGLIRNMEALKNIEGEKENLEIDIENLSGEINLLDRRLREAEAMKKALEEQLELTNYEEIQKEIDECLRLLREIPPLLEGEIERKTEQLGIFNGAVEELIHLTEKIQRREMMGNIHKEIFAEEFKLNYLGLQDMENEYKNASFVLKEIKTQDKQEREDYIRFLYGKFTENTQYLREYLLRMDNVFERNLEEESEEIAEVFSRAKRLSITGKIRGKDVDFYKLLDFIREGIEENERLLRESDRQLFEDILVKNISKKIRAKIYHSDLWVKRMNELMENMNTSSGLSFSLRWTSKKAESEGQLDTKELVELLKQEGSLMKESDLNKLSEHFRSKIAEARRLQEDMGKNQSFHSIMREILDYRKWFEFKLYFVKTGQGKKELTNNAFYQFSGGEKAMAMYVPLFSAVYARYEGARRDCPRLVSLDEAFAGVDEKNIRDMFRLLNELQLDFMINSQILWGDYDTVPSLSISELIRPDNAKFVTVIRYHWNGRVKELVV
ncbi:TIGR02680 family protein [Anaerosolibacter sp.]|uniref:TIGR02680 family protein n=1 Tax=Anaerosolibacter sp. TaxID=1872527 RepID=UPI0039F06B87